MIEAESKTEQAADPTPSSPDSLKDSGPALSSDPPPKTSGGPLWRVMGMVKTSRPHQWVKNLFVLAPVVFAKDLFEPALLIRAFGAFGVFCLLAGAVYTLNDIVDVEADRLHPVKRHRPIASGRVPIKLAKVMGIGLVVVGLGGAFYGPLPFFAVALGYILLNIAYSFKLKNVAYVDVGCIATMFVMRVAAGGFATGIEVSWYLIACTALLALFLGFGKRRHELAQASRSARQRAALQAYSPHALTAALAVTGVATIGTYVAYTLDPSTRAFFKSDWLWLTTPSVVNGVIRFVQLVAGHPKSESPTQEMLRDVPFVINLVVWAIIMMVIVYRLRPS